MNPPCSGCAQVTHAVEWSVEFERRLCCACYLRMCEARARDPWPYGADTQTFDLDGAA